MMWGWHVDMGWGWWIFGPVMMIVFWGLVAWVIVSLTRESVSPTTRMHSDSAREIADRRLASGEIDSEEHRRILQQLEKSRHGIQG